MSRVCIGWNIKKFKIFLHFIQEGSDMEITLHLEPAVALFYTRISASAGVPLEQVISDALFKLAGELSLEALKFGG
jgi:hypothetical protein